MGLFNLNYSKPGPGISKDAPKKKGLNRFYEVFFAKFWRLIQLNFLYIINSIPAFIIMFILSGMISNKVGTSLSGTITTALGIDPADAQNLQLAQISVALDVGVRFFVSVLFGILWGMGPSNAGLVYITRSFIWEEPVFILTEYIHYVKTNFKQSCIIFVIDVVAFMVLYYGFLVYASMPAPMNYLVVVIGALSVFYTLMHTYLYHLSVTYKLTIPKLYKNAAMFTIVSFPFCLLAYAVIIFVAAIFPAIIIVSVHPAITYISGIAAVLLYVCLLGSAAGFIKEYAACTLVARYIAEDADVERNN